MALHPSACMLMTPVCCCLLPSSPFFSPTRTKLRSVASTSWQEKPKSSRCFWKKRQRPMATRFYRDHCSKINGSSTSSLPGTETTADMETSRRCAWKQLLVFSVLFAAVGTPLTLLRRGGGLLFFPSAGRRVCKCQRRRGGDQSSGAGTFFRLRLSPGPELNACTPKHSVAVGWLVAAEGGGASRLVSSPWAMLTRP